MSRATRKHPQVWDDTNGVLFEVDLGAVSRSHVEYVARLWLADGALRHPRLPAHLDHHAEQMTASALRDPDLPEFWRKPGRLARYLRRWLAMEVERPHGGADAREQLS